MGELDRLRPQVIARFCSGKSPKEIAHELAAPLEVVLHLVGERIGKTLINPEPEEVDDMPEMLNAKPKTKTDRIRELYDQGLKPKAIAEQVGCPVSSVYSIVSVYRQEKGLGKPRAVAKPSAPETAASRPSAPAAAATTEPPQRKAPPLQSIRRVWLRRGYVAEQQKILADTAIHTIDLTERKYPDDPDKAATLCTQLLTAIERMYEDVELSS